MEESYSRTEYFISPNCRIDLVLGFTSLYLLVKSYNNSLIGEVSQQMYGGVLRCISLGSTEGLSTWKCSMQLNVQAVVVPVGRISLGRILNVVGSAVDVYDDQPIVVLRKNRNLEEWTWNLHFSLPSIASDQALSIVQARFIGLVHILVGFTVYQQHTYIHTETKLPSFNN